jgi:two-component system NarL family response regulator
MSFDANKRNKMALLVEEKPICREAFGQILREQYLFDLVDTKSELHNLAETASHGDYQLILIDLFTINHNFELLRSITSRFGGAGMLAVDDRYNPLFSRAAEAIGLSGYVAKISEMETLFEAISTVLAGEKWYSHRVGPEDNSEARAKSGDLAIGLTTRQSEILAQLSLGRTNQEIAWVLGISPGTVKAHVHAILKQVGARNRTEAALLAGRLFRNGIADR